MQALVTIIYNLPNLILRIVVWHGFSVGISVFVLKNIILIARTCYGFYLHKAEKYEIHKREQINESTQGEDAQSTTEDTQSTSGTQSQAGNDVADVEMELDDDPVYVDGRTAV